MTTRSNGNCSVTSTDVLIAMLSHDLRGSRARPDLASRRRDPRELADAAAVDAVAVTAAAATAATAGLAARAANDAAGAAEPGAPADRDAPAR